MRSSLGCASMTSAQLDFFSEPCARHGDPRTSHLAAASVAPAIPALNGAILQASWGLYCPSTAFELADQVRRVHGDRWDESTIRTRVSQLHKAGELIEDGVGKSPRGSVCGKYRLPSMGLRYSESIEDVPTGNVL